jgi:hypothetical protein
MRLDGKGCCIGNGLISGLEPDKFYIGFSGDCLEVGESFAFDGETYEIESIGRDTITARDEEGNWKHFSKLVLQNTLKF